MKVVWTQFAINRLNELTIFLSEHIGVDDANLFKQELVQFSIESLENYPERNPPCQYLKLREQGYRCLKFKKKYIVVYKEYENLIQIIGVGSSDQNPHFFNSLV